MHLFEWLSQNLIQSNHSGQSGQRELSYEINKASKANQNRKSKKKAIKFFHRAWESARDHVVITCSEW